MAFGVTTEGFKTKRLADIRTETLEAWRQKFGAGFAIPDNSPEGQVKGILDERISLLWELGEAVSRAYVPAFAQGVQVDAILALTGNIRKMAVKSRVSSGRAFGVLGTALPNTLIISVVGNSAARFKLVNPASINNAGINEIQKLAFSATPTAGTFIIVFPEGNTVAVNWNDAAATVQAKCESVLGVGNITVTGSITLATGLTLTYVGAEGLKNRAQATVTSNTLVNAGPAVAITPSTLTEGSRPFSDLLTLDAESTGPVEAPTGSLTVIETPIVGLETFTNEEDAVLGRNTEVDANAKLRREQEIQLAGAATPDAIRADLLAINDVTAALVFENDSDIIDLDGRPPHSIDIVVEGGDNQDIADRIWATRGGGIETIGDITESVTDSQGFTQEVKFSRPTPVDIWVEVDLVTNSQYPVDGDALVAAAILAYGEALTIGQDVIVYGSAPSLACSFDEIPGITDFTLRIGTAAAPTLDDNIPIAPRERADFDSGRITVNSP